MVWTDSHMWSCRKQKKLLGIRKAQAMSLKSQLVSWRTGLFSALCTEFDPFRCPHCFVDAVTIFTLSSWAAAHLSWNWNWGGVTHAVSGTLTVIACCRDANEDKQPQSRYGEVASKGKESFQDNNVTNLYQNANKSANAIADSGKDKAQDKAKKDT